MHAISKIHYTTYPKSAGKYFHMTHLPGTDGNVLSQVTVTETPAAGRMCKHLRMGGSAQCGFANWSGYWRKTVY